MGINWKNMQNYGHYVKKVAKIAEKDKSCLLILLPFEETPKIWI